MSKQAEAVLSITKARKDIAGVIRLDGSKSISNRVLVIGALCDRHFDVAHLSTSDDTRTLKKILARKRGTLDAGAAGTTFRFSTAYFAFRKGTQILTGSERMLHRPMGILVSALQQLGAHIEYLGEEGYPPLKIYPPRKNDRYQISIPSGTSSQFISALLLIAPTLPRGLVLQLSGDIVSKPYIDMTLAIMAYFGASAKWSAGNTIIVKPQNYLDEPYIVEADWSAASYHYAIASLAENVTIKLKGIFRESIQGDSIIVKIMEKFGVETHFAEEGVVIRRYTKELPEYFEFDFSDAPDIAQTIAVVCAGLGINAKFYGLKTLNIKETNRIKALQTELNKVNVSIRPFSTAGSTPDAFYLQGKAIWKGKVVFDTYEDHRMAMALAPLAILGDIAIKNPSVVNKSYRRFWEDLRKIGIEFIED